MEAPPSPGTAPAKLEECIEEIVKLTLMSCIDGTLELDIGLSPHYCSRLLLHDDDSSSSTYSYSNSTDLTEGIPPYPLYKSLALSLCKSISSGAFCRPIEKTTLIQTDKFPKQKEEDWSKLIQEKGSDLVQMLKMLDFDLHVQQPFFSQLKDGLKTVEGRCFVGNYKRISPGSLILFNKSLVLQVQDVHNYATFSEMLEAESIEKVLPGVNAIEEGVQIYRKFYPEEKERLNGVLAIRVAKPSFQLSDAMASILKGLSYEGVQRLLGLVYTDGTVPAALPPPRSSLLSSFLSPHNANVESSTLTNGARSLAKHVDRSNAKFWGNFSGNDSVKNMLALDVINKLIANCCWLNIVLLLVLLFHRFKFIANQVLYLTNMHIVPPHGVVFEIRVCDGYGARWLEDGTKFIGFLEPYMEDGHLKRWKH